MYGIGFITDPEEQDRLMEIAKYKRCDECDCHLTCTTPIPPEKLAGALTTEDIYRLYFKILKRRREEPSTPMRTKTKEDWEFEREYLAKKYGDKDRQEEE